MNKKVLVKLSWIADAIDCNPLGGCDFHMARLNPKFCSPCGCCQLAKAYYDAKRKTRKAKKGGVR